MSDYKGGGIWCICELRHGRLMPTVFELITAARKLKEATNELISVISIGGPGKASEAATAAMARGADKVYVIEHAILEAFTDEAYARAIKELIDREKPSKILLPSSVMGRALAARLSVQCRSGMASDVTEVSADSSGRLQAIRPTFGGNLLVSVVVTKGPEIATVRPMSYPRSDANAPQAQLVPFAIDPSSWVLKTKFIRYQPEETKEIDLSSAEKIVSGGRGLGNAQGFELIRNLAHTLGAAVGASRATVDAGWIPYRHQVGLTGRTVRPRIYFACGISGQIQHLAGMSSSDVIIAINTDPDCPMMKMANFAVEGDLYQVIPAIIAEIKKQRGESHSSTNGH